jgi:cell division septum initiation protein DivIVA
MTTKYKQHRDEEIAELEREVEEKEEARKKAENRAQRAELEADDLREAVEATAYLARTDAGRVIYSGEHEAEAITKAKAHYWRTSEHVSLDDSPWSTRKFGGVRRARRAAL